jgi:hypothetical protein
MGANDVEDLLNLDGSDAAPTVRADCPNLYRFGAPAVATFLRSILSVEDLAQVLHHTANVHAAHDSPPTAE